MDASVEAVMETLEEAGTEQNRTVYARHGVGPDQFGVSFKELRSLGKKLKGDMRMTMEAVSMRSRTTVVPDPMIPSARVVGIPR